MSFALFYTYVVLDIKGFKEKKKWWWGGNQTAEV